MPLADLDHLARDLIDHILADGPGRLAELRPRLEEWARVALRVALQEERQRCRRLVQSHLERCGKYCCLGPDRSHDADCLGNLLTVLQEELP